ncbi:MAG: MBL fold metallo-hydrolase [Fibromonadaceae bacterium]|jgi:L-ascorbate metabolism protein UlaG (beta-lactamase superfamily)|nr:MBL fold metallo-hydrolase [Fibromonadaceae bacterium]
MRLPIIIVALNGITITLLSLCSFAFGEIMPIDEQFSDSGRVQPVFKDGEYSNPFTIDSSQIQPRRKGGVLNWLRPKEKVTKPKKTLPAQQVNIEQAFPKNQNGLHVTWLGHANVLMQIDGVRLLIDPVFVNNVSPVFFVRIKRFQKKAPVTIKELPFIDAVFISHDHYDHLNADAMLELEPKVGYFLMPTGVAQYFRKWGIEESKIREYAWWEEGAIQGASGQILRFACTPSRHFSKRSLFERNKTLWASWVFMGSTHRVFYSGDTGYGLHFKQIGHHYGPFDLTLMENGQYSVYWPYSHVTPEQGVQAHLDLRGKVMMPIHWGSFDLSIHDWWEPIERAVQAAESHGVPLLTPEIGQTLSISENPITKPWWRNYINP